MWKGRDRRYICENEVPASGYSHAIDNSGGGGENQGPLVIYDIDIQLRTLKIKMQLLFKGSDVIRPHFGAREEA